MVLRWGVVVRVCVGQLPELASEGDLRRVVEVLIAEQDHPPRIERLCDCFHDLGHQWLRDVDTADLGADTAGDWLNVQLRGDTRYGIGSGGDHLGASSYSARIVNL